MNPQFPPGPRNVPPEPGDGPHAPRNRTQMVTPIRIFWFLLSSASFLCALVAFSKTHFYKSTIQWHGSVVSVIFFCVIITTHMVTLISLSFFGFCNVACERYRQHFLIKSVGDFLVMFLECSLVLAIGHRHLNLVSPPEAAPPSLLPYYLGASTSNAAPYPMMAPYDQTTRFSEVAGLVTCAFLTVDSLSIINLLRPGHHYSIFEAMSTMTMHMSLELLNMCPYLSAFVASFIFLILVVKNFCGKLACPRESRAFPCVDIP
jgi:hypothetical protein